MSDEIDIGQTLREAREKRGLTQAEVANATRIKLHIIEAIEGNDFRRIGVPLYGKGFVKLFAECVGLDPAPLTRQYILAHARAVRPSLRADSPAAGSARPRAVRPESAPVIPPRFGGLHLQYIVQDISGALRDGTERLAGWLTGLRATLGGGRRSAPYVGGYRRSRLTPELRFFIIAGVAAALLIVLIVFGIVRLSSKVRAASGGGATAVSLRLAEEPPAPYVQPRGP